MKHITFYLDFISPYAYLAFEKLPEALKGLSYSVTYKPLLFAGLLKHWGQKGPAEIESKRAWTFRHVQWLAHHHGIELQAPAQHPFNPLALLRLMLACAPAGGAPNRYVCERVLHHVWRGGLDANDPARLAALASELAPAREPGAESVKRELAAHTEAAIARGLFGVPTIDVDGRQFWGFDSLDMVSASLRGDPWFKGSAWDEAGAPRPGVKRKT